MEIFNLPAWNGKPFVIGDLFMLKKDNRTARCALQTHPLGLELRISAGNDLLQSQVCRSQDDVLNTAESFSVDFAPCADVPIACDNYWYRARRLNMAVLSRAPSSLCSSPGAC